MLAFEVNLVKNDWLLATLNSVDFSASAEPNDIIKLMGTRPPMLSIEALFCDIQLKLSYNSSLI